MRSKALTRKRLSTESVGFFLFLFLLFVTPLVEALKNILIVGLFIWWLTTGNVRRDLLTMPSYMTCLLLLSILPLITLLSSDLTVAGELIFDVKGAVKFGMALLPVYSLSVMGKGQEKATTLVLIALVAGGLMACVDSFVSGTMTEESYVELRGVGHVNQSALYLIVVIISAGTLTWSKGIGPSVFGWTALVVLSAFLIPSRSLNAFAVLICIVMLWIGMLIIDRKYTQILSMSICLAIAMLAYLSLFPNAGHSWNSLKTEISERFDGDDGSHCGHGISSCRFNIYRTVLEVYEHHRWFGVGPDQFGKATSETEIRAELEREGRDYDSEKHKFYHTNHGHNVWLNVLVERGMAGIVVLALFFALSGYRILSLAIHVLARQREGSRPTQLLFLSSATWTMMFVGGIANTTLHLEHGLVGMMLLVWSLMLLEQAVSDRGSINEGSCIARREKRGPIGGKGDLPPLGHDALRQMAKPLANLCGDAVGKVGAAPGRRKIRVD